MIFPIRMTGGEDKLRVNCGTPTIRSLVLSGLFNREFVEHHFATAWRSLLRSEMATLRSEGGSAKSKVICFIKVARGPVRTTATVESRKMAAILQIIG